MSTNAHIIVRMVAFEGLQPMATEAFMIAEHNQCGLEEVRESNGSWTNLIIVVVVIKIISFAAVTFAMWKLYKYVEKLIEENNLRMFNTLGDRVDGAEFQMVELERMMRENEDETHQIDLLRIHSGLLPKGKREHQTLKP